VGGLARVAPHGFAKGTVINVKKGAKNVSPTMALLVARLAGVSVDDLLAGKVPVARNMPSLWTSIITSAYDFLARPM
jgi:hypothetical protein